MKKTFLILSIFALNIGIISMSEAATADQTLSSLEALQQDVSQADISWNQKIRCQWSLSRQISWLTKNQTQSDQAIRTYMSDYTTANKSCLEAVKSSKIQRLTNKVKKLKKLQQELADKNADTISIKRTISGAEDRLSILSLE